MVGGKTISYRELEPATRRVAALLGLYGIRKGDRVALLSESSPSWGIDCLGVSRTGAILVPILTDFTQEQIANILEHSGAKAIIVSRRFTGKVEKEGFKRLIFSAETLACIARPVADGGSPLHGNASQHGSSVLPENTAPQAKAQSGAQSGTGTEPESLDDAILDEAIRNFSDAQVKPDDTFEIVYTSGTTGLSKGVVLTHRNLILNGLACRSIIILTRVDRLLSILPLAHTYEFTIGFTIPIMAGSAIYYMDRPPSATALLPALKTVRPTIMLSVPLVIEKIFRASIKPALEKLPAYSSPILKPVLEFLAGMKLKKTFGGHIRFFGIGGAPLAPDVEAFLKTARFPYAIGYGLTECSPLLAGCNPAKTRLRSTGPALAGVELRIADKNPATGEGEIQARGPTIFSGYFKDTDRTREAFTEDGWFRTGDLGAFDDHGYVYVRGRLKTMILGASGENIYPEEIEAIINRSPYVNESLVYGDESGLTALVHLKPEVLEELEARLKDGLEGAGDTATRIGQAVADAEKSLEKAASQVLERIKKETNDRLAAFSRIKKVKIQTEPFEKTPTQKIKRFLYPKNSHVSGEKGEHKGTVT